MNSSHYKLIFYIVKKKIKKTIKFIDITVTVQLMIHTVSWKNKKYGGILWKLKMYICGARILKPITLKNIMKFALPTIAMSLFMAFYTMVDGLFVSNLIGTNALSAINLSAPIISLVTAISTMLATGGSAVIMKKAGEKKQQEANENFTFLIVVNIVVGVTMTLIGYLCMNMLFSQMDVSADVLHHTKDYLSRYLLFTISY